MKDIKTYIDESLFARQDDDSIAKKTEAAIEKEAIKKFKECCIDSNFDEYQIHLGPKGYEITGPDTQDLPYGRSSCIILYRIDEKSLNYKISKFQGVLIINACEAKSMDWLFTDDCDFRGVLIVEWNGYLTSLRGCPESVAAFKCVFNHNLKSLDGAPKQCKKFVWFDNGDVRWKLVKKIQIKDIKKYLKTKNADISVAYPAA